MFQYAAGLALAHRWNTVLKLDVSWFSEGNAAAAHERYGLDCFVVDAHLHRRVNALKLRTFILTLPK